MIDANGNGITTSWTHSSINNSPMNDIEGQVDDNGPGVQKHTFPEKKSQYLLRNMQLTNWQHQQVMLLMLLQVGVVTQLIMMLQT